MALTLALCLHPVAARVGTLVAGLFLAVPCFLWAQPLPRGLLMCLMGLPFAVVVLSILAPPTTGVRARLAYLSAWLGTREVTRRARSFDSASLLHLIGATAIFAAALAVVKAVPVVGPWLPVRWLAGGIMLLGFAELATAGHNFLTALMGVTGPSLMQSPVLSASINEFWTKRWNPAASVLVFRNFVFAPLARRGPVLALCAAFSASALLHVLLCAMATCQWGISLMCGSFFLLQPVLILAERRMKVRRWRPAAGRAWTLAALAITSPLFVEPGLQLVAPSWGAPDNLLWPTIAVLAWGMIFTVCISLAWLTLCPEPAPANRNAITATAFERP